MVDLVLDRDIRIWVFLPIVLLTFLLGVVKHYVSILITTTRKPELQQVYDSQALIRVRYLRENGKFLPLKSFLMRKHYFNDEDSGWLKTQNRPAPASNPMQDPGMMTEMLKGNLINVIPMIVIGGWINWTFSGFLTTKVPFPLTLRFKPMLQRGIELVSLDASWVSSASWYFLNLFGLRSIYALVLGEDNAADSTDAMQEQMTGAAMKITDPKAAFKAEWEALEVVEHKWMLANVEEDLCSKPLF
ncbi:ER membrane protein complex subunit 3 [Galendromus occidentalis]|uniref:ER membrane protein complex subunit 3 n=1 Tax=Galendromus occidentalis TaxID=34638 RepID=A0AAJ6QSG9_9ACAR|nr:ER membrane protein complex subunit 3 [Galendromus occidentalis]